METWTIILIVVLFILISGLVVMLLKTFPIAKRVYEQMLVRKPDAKRERACSAPDNEEQVQMWNAGCDWAARHQDVMQEVSIENEGLRLYGELYRFGGNRLAIIVPGRCECLKYSYYYAEPYEKAGMNVLVYDARSTGLSDGVYNTVGGGESKDLRAWAQYMQEQFQMEEIWLHTICLGSAAAFLMMTRPDCPKAVKGLIADGAFVSFRETNKTHMQDINKPVFPVCDLMMFCIWKYSGYRPRKLAPIRVVGKLRHQVVFLYTKLDKFSLPEKSRRLFAKCGSQDKRLVWFEKGGHSHIRINNTQQYDQVVLETVGK